jgi:phosphinothricin acetyltransferase
VIHNQGVTLRSAVPGDAAALLSIYEPLVRESAISFEIAPPSLEEFRSRIETVLSKWVWLVAERDSTVLGYAYGGAHRTRSAYQWSVETSICVALDSRGRGIGLFLYEQLLSRLAQRGYCNAYAAIALPNEASIALHRRAGFTHVGIFERVGRKFGRWHDVSWWQRRLREVPPIEP